MSKLIIMSGVPGSGKTTFVEKLDFFYKKHAQSYRKDALHIVSSDNLREELLGDRRDHSNEELIWETFYNLPFKYIKDYKENTITVLDATHVIAAKRLEVAAKYRDLYDEIIIVQVSFNPRNIFEINRVRKHPIPPDVLVGFCEIFEKLSDEEIRLYNCIHVRKHQYNEALFRELLDF